MDRKKRTILLTVILVISLVGMFLSFPEKELSLTSQIDIPNNVNYSEVDYKEGVENINIRELEGIKINKEGHESMLILRGINKTEGNSILQLNKEDKEEEFKLEEEEFKKLDLDSNGEYDILIRLNKLGDEEGIFDIEGTEGKADWKEGISNNLFGRNNSLFVFLTLLLLSIGVIGYIFHLYFLPLIIRRRIADVEDNIAVLKYMFRRYKDFIYDGKIEKAKNLYERINHFKKYMTEKEKENTSVTLKDIERLYKNKIKGKKK